MVNKTHPELQTPMMRQYFSMKEKHPRELLFFRMGDFYEMFFEDAREASDILGIALTSRSKDKNAIPMAGIPVRAIDSYLPKLLKAGKRVAICEQTQDARDARGLVEREVVRVVSPGTITDDKLIGEKSNNYLASIVTAKAGYGLAWIDISTGEFFIWESREVTSICTHLARLEPAECLLPESLMFTTLDAFPALKPHLDLTVQTPYADPLFDADVARTTLTEHFGTRTLEGFGCEHLTLGVRAGGALLHYVASTQKESLQHVTRVLPFQSTKYVPVDRPTRLALELMENARTGERGHTLLGCLDVTTTALGARRLREWLMTPLVDVEAIVERQDAVDELVRDGEAREALREQLRHIHDLERICARIAYKSANGRDLVGLRRSLEMIPKLRAGLSEREPRLLQHLAANLEIPNELADSIAAALVDEPPTTVREGGLIRSGYHEELDELREISTQGTRWIAKYQQKEVERTRIPSLKIGYNKVFGYFIEVTNTHQDRIPEEYIRKQTLKNCERFVTSELKEYETKVLQAGDQSVELEYDLFVAVRNEAAKHIPIVQRAAEALSHLDVICTFAEIAAERGYIRPTVNDGLRLNIEDGRHPVLERLSMGEEFVANGIDLDADRTLMIVTGPNMAGKSTYMRQIALLTLMSQVGSFIPARQAEIGVVDRIFTRVGAADDLARGQSTFMVEMYETANILNNATERSLLILDEVGRGTSTFDGVSLAWAIVEELAQRIGARTLFATHYHELTALAASFPNVHNYSIAVKEWNETIIFLRKVVEGGSDKSYGIHVARLAGIPGAVLERARQILSQLESHGFEVDPDRTRRRDGGDAAAEAASVMQLDLFQDGNDKIVRELQALDTDNMTPLQSLHFLVELKKRLG